MTRLRFRWVVLPVILLGASLLLLQHRSTRGQASDSWRQLSLSEFVQEMERITTAPEEPSEEVWAAIRAQSAERLLQAISTGTAADYGHLVSLYLWARAVLSPEEVQTAQAALVPTTNQVGSWSVEQLRSVQQRMTQAQLPVATVQALSVSWLEGRDCARSKTWTTWRGCGSRSTLWGGTTTRRGPLASLGPARCRHRPTEPIRSASARWTCSTPLWEQSAKRTCRSGSANSRFSTRPPRVDVPQRAGDAFGRGAAELAGGAVGQSLPGEPAGPISGGGPAAVGRSGPGPTAGALHGPSHARRQRDGVARPLRARDCKTSRWT